MMINMAKKYCLSTGIRVNSVNPAIVSNNFIARSLGNFFKQIIKTVLSMLLYF